jgi:hypothetical protein
MRGNTVWKVFISSESLPGEYLSMFDITPIEALEYEFEFYKDIIRPLLDYKISPHFIRYYDMKQMSLQEYVKMLVPPLELRQVIRNVMYMYNQDENRPRIDAPVDSGDTHYYTNATAFKALNKYKDLKISYMELQSIDKAYTRVFGHSINRRASKVQFDNMEDRLELYIMLFQIAQACYALNLSRAIHNDLHDGNVWVTKKDPSDPASYVKVSYLVNGKQYNIRSNICCRIYDFDRSYAFKLGHNDRLVDASNELCPFLSQCNYVAGSKDFVKILYYVYKLADKVYKAELLRLIIPESDPHVNLRVLSRTRSTAAASAKPKTIPLSVFTQQVYAEGPFLQDANKKAVEEEIYSNYRPLPEIIDLLYKLILETKEKVTSPSSGNLLPVTFTDAPQHTFTCSASGFSPEGMITLSEDCCYEK